MSAFTIAFQVPNLVRSLFVDAAIQAAFVLVFTEELGEGNRREAFRLASTLTHMIALVLGAITAIFVLPHRFSSLSSLRGSAGDPRPHGHPLADPLPIPIMLGATGMVVGVLNSYDRFLAAFAIAPFFWNLTIITVLVLVAPAFEWDDRIYAYAIGVLAGTAIQLAIPAFDLRNTPFRPLLKLDWRMPDVRRVLLLMLPVTLSLGLINFNLVINSFFGTWSPTRRRDRQRSGSTCCPGDLLGRGRDGGVPDARPFRRPPRVRRSPLHDGERHAADPPPADSGGRRRARALRADYPARLSARGIRCRPDRSGR